MDELGTHLSMQRSKDGKTVMLVITSDVPITTQEFLLEVEQYLHMASQAAAERMHLEADH